MQVPLQTAPNSGVPAAASRRRLAGDDGWRMLLVPVREVGGLTVWERRPSVELDEARRQPPRARASDVAPQGAGLGLRAPRARGELPKAAGVMYVEPDGRVLLVRRSDEEKNYAGHWAWPGGRLDPGESPKHAAARESEEEIGHAPDLSDLTLLSTGDGKYYTYKCNVDGKFEPSLNEEHTDWEWALPSGNLPSPLHPGVAQLLHEMGKGGAQDAEFDVNQLRDENGKWKANAEAHELVEKLPKAPLERAWFDNQYGPEIDRRVMHPTGPEPRVLGAAGKKMKPDAVIKVHKSLLPMGQSSVTVGKVHQYIDDPQGGPPDYSYHEGGQYPGFHPISGSHRLAAAIARGEEYIPVGVYHESGAYGAKPTPAKQARERLKTLFPTGVAEPKKTEGAHDESCLAFSLRPPDTTMAIDRQSVRRPDADGRMHVTATPISKATINPYWGREIPGYEELGLDPDQQYRLLRHPDELARAAPSFNNLPLLSRHVAVSALDHHPELVVGSTGTDAAYGHPYLSNSLVVWAKPAIDDVESGTKKELSCAYRYRPDMTPGVYEGQKYDGVMRDIVGNHVALVKEGRAGPDVVVGDSKEQIPMAARKPMSRVGTLAMGATIAFLAPKLAKDEKVDLMPIFRRITPKNYLSDLPKIVRAVEEAVDGKLAFDATPEGLHTLLEALSKVAPKEEEIPAAGAEGERDPMSADPTRMVRKDAEEDPMMGGGEQPEGSPEGGEEQSEGSPEAGGGEDPMEAVKAFIKANMDPDKFAELEQMMAQLGGGGPGEGEDAGVEGGPAEFEGRPKVGARDKRPMGGKDKRPAMDEVEKMIRAAVDGERRQAKELREAEQFVFPYVGRLAGAFDSAEAVYRTALTMKKVDAREVKEVAALRLLLSCQHKMVDAPKVAPRVAQDSASMDDYHKLFGNLDVGFA